MAVAGDSLIVTGGLGALGRAVVARAIEAGWAVTVVDAAEGDLGPEVRIVGGVDLTDPASTDEAFLDASVHVVGTPSLVNLAGGFVWQTACDGDPAAWTRMHAMNVSTALNASRAARRHLPLHGGAVVNVGAYAALGPAAAGMGAYAAAKAGVHALTQSLAAEWADDGIRVNAVCPSTLDTPANRAAMPDADPATWVHLEDLADVILWLASPASRALTGALIPVTRGRG